MDSDRLTEEAIAVFETLTGLESLDLHDGPLGEHEMPDRLGERPACLVEHLLGLPSKDFSDWCDSGDVLAPGRSGARTRDLRR